MLNLFPQYYANSFCQRYANLFLPAVCQFIFARTCGFWRACRSCVTSPFWWGTPGNRSAQSGLSLLPAAGTYRPYLLPLLAITCIPAGRFLSNHRSNKRYTWEEIVSSLNTAAFYNARDCFDPFLSIYLRHLPYLAKILGSSLIIYARLQGSRSMIYIIWSI